MDLLAHLAARFKEPSSWAGLTGLAALVGLHLDPGLAQSVVFVGAGVAGIVAFFVPEKK
jgi:hypothetical protein